MPPKRKSKKKSLTSSTSSTPKQKVAQRLGKSRKTKGVVREELSGNQVIQGFEKLCSEDKFDEARKYLNSLKNIHRWQYLNFQSVIEFKTGNLRKAEAVLREADREPNSSYAVRKNLAALLITQGRMREALPFAKKANEESNYNLKILQLYINCLLDLGMSKEAHEVTLKGKELYPEDKSVLVSYASSLRSLMRNEEAEIEIDRLIKKFPEEPVIHRIKADLLGDKSTKLALPHYEKANQLAIEVRKKEDPAIMWNMSLHLLRARQLKKGWECWEQGFHPVVGTMGRNLPKRITDLDRADSEGREIDPEKWTIICSEQGIGDQILFMHSMHECIEEFKKIIFVCERRMHPIIKRSFPQLVVGCAGITYDWAHTNVKKNGYIPLGSLPRRHRHSLEQYKDNKKPYLIANKDQYHKTRNYLKKTAKGRPIIGISWKGGYWQIQRKSKALDITNWLPIFSKNALFVNLQYGNIDKELEYLKSHGKTLMTFPKVDYKINLDGWLSISAACDGIISVSTALVHFAGAIGQKVAIVMPGQQGPWHLGLEDKESFAYKNVKIFRPEGNEQVKDVIDRVANLIIE